MDKDRKQDRKLFHKISPSRHDVLELNSRPSLVRVVMVPKILHTALRTILFALDLKRKMAHLSTVINFPVLIRFKA